MRHNVDGRKLGRNASHRKALYRNLVIALITHERIRTTTPKAKEARRLAERMITFAKRGDLHARRHVASILNDKTAVRKLFDEIGPRFAERQGGYTRVLKLSAPRKGDSAEMAMLELVKDGDRPKKKRSARKAAAPAKPAPAAGPAAKEAAVKEAVVEPDVEEVDAAEGAAESETEETEKKG
jgi:large subunit ribosomal protein L17